MAIDYDYAWLSLVGLCMAIACCTMHDVARWTVHGYRCLDYAWLSIVGLCMAIDCWTMHDYRLLDYAWLSIVGLCMLIDYWTMHLLWQMHCYALSTAFLSSCFDV